MEPDVLQTCYQRYQRELYLYLCALCGSQTLAEDIWAMASIWSLSALEIP